MPVKAGVGGVRLEYRYPLDKRGFDAEINQALLDLSIALREISSVRSDLRYNVSSLLAGIGAARHALEGYRLGLESEKQKFREAEERYRTGRTETDKLIQFESDFYLAELSLEQQKIDLAHKYTGIEHGLTGEGDQGVTDNTRQLHQWHEPLFF